MQQQKHLNQVHLHGFAFIGFAEWVPCAGLVEGAFADCLAQGDLQGCSLFSILGSKTGPAEFLEGYNLTPNART